MDLPATQLDVATYKSKYKKCSIFNYTYIVSPLAALRVRECDAVRTGSRPVERRSGLGAGPRGARRSGARVGDKC